MSFDPLPCSSSFSAYLTENFQYSFYHQSFKQFMQRLKRSYVQGKPRFLTDPENSLYDILQYEAFTKMESAEVQSRFSKKHIVVRNWPHDPKLEFDASGLRKLVGSLSRQTSLHG